MQCEGVCVVNAVSEPTQHNRDVNDEEGEIDHVNFALPYGPPYDVHLNKLTLS